jgi:octaprenyl-diphosphate synthase
LKLKTAELFALSCELGGLISGLQEEALNGLREYGFSLGIAYQIYDDCLDIFGDEAQVGKSLGTDLATGKLTLPVLQLLEKVPAAEKNEIKSKLFQWNGGQMQWLMELLKRFQTLEDSNEVMQDYVSQANTALSVVGGTGRNQALEQLLAYLSHQIAKLSY